ncbi:uncharacterized protein YukE [Allocatelliglobosispora scoriae]|uniref:Uncharacterized protein YukE n=1 Tax=Allocatelliglobosispora scoriae TaxID=643052 RepID=A0A841C1F2_9ACTN|nr:hypothetical protein [Allocatelliglobosispora scoriae]MBB5872800.1 uncharacterized protein YukE [Allocatelliglobosispora scoriae]
MSTEVHPPELRRTAALLDDAAEALLAAGDKLSRVAVPADPHAADGPDVGGALSRLGRRCADETFALKIAAEQLANGLREAADQAVAADNQAARALRYAAGAGV